MSLFESEHIRPPQYNFVYKTNSKKTYINFQIIDDFAMEYLIFEFKLKNLKTIVMVDLNASQSTWGVQETLSMVTT